MDFETIIKAWRLAANDLRFKLQSPVVLTGSDNKEIRFGLLIEKFGSP